MSETLSKPLTSHVGRMWRRRLGKTRALWVYLVVDALLLVGAVVLPWPASWFALVAVTVLGPAALAVGVWRKRPDVPVAWWLVVAGSAVGAALFVTDPLILGRSPIAPLPSWFVAFPLALWYALFIAGLALLASLGGRPDPGDMVDAAVVVLAVFLVLFAVIIHPVLGGGWAVVTGVISPLGALLIFAMAIRILFAVGVPTVSVGLLLLGASVIAAAALSIVLPALATTGLAHVFATRQLPTITVGSHQIGSPTLGLALAYSVLLGAAGVHASLGHTRYLRRQRAVLPTRRMVLAAVMAVVVTFAWWFEVRRAGNHAYTAVGFTIPVVLSAMLLFMLVLRLSLVARLAQRRAGELARRSVQLARRSDELAESVHEQEILQRQLRYRAMHDPLTGLSNRVVLAERMEWALNRRTGSGRHSLALMDLDHFKDVNDSLGHPTGDELLVEVSHRLLEAVPSGGTLARLGGDEFAVLLEDTPENDAVAWAEDVRRSLHRPYHVGDQDFFLSTSVGLLTTGSDGRPPTPSEALRDADLALYAAKAAGKDRVMVFRPELREAQLDHIRLSAGLRRAVANNELTMEYQPIVDLATHRITSVEALLRWIPNGQPSIPPSEFIPVAEDTGMIGAIGTWVMRHALRDVRPWFNERGITVAVNVSARQLDDPGLANMVLETLRYNALPGQALIIEITESNLMAMSTASKSIDQLHRLRDHNVRIAVDDFGTGYSSLAYVSRLPLDLVKIDSSFIQNPAAAGVESPDWAFTRAILQLVDTLHLQTVAEGVETLEQAETLRTLNCPLAQGYLFARPMSSELLQSVLSNGELLDRVLSNPDTPPPTP